MIYCSKFKRISVLTPRNRFSTFTFELWFSPHARVVLTLIYEVKTTLELIVEDLDRMTSSFDHRAGLNGC